MLGMIYNGPISHVVYTYVLPAIAPMSRGVSITQVALKKVTFDQTVIAPLVTMGYFPLLSLIHEGSF